MAISFDYSLLIMWAYFIVYILMFVVVSILCAVEVHKEKEPKANCCKLIKVWVMSLWHKKKIYGELLPHFFDQATDFGVVYEFGKYYYAEKDGAAPIGINTQYLFILSISIILTHRVVSAVAVYNLTHKPMYAIYQLLDVLMIQCVYTNYKLDTNQPSNAQRYLQTMEAIFESAPQILISTAFLIKTKQTQISATVLASLFTSLFSLSARVSADDKVMLQEDWKEPKFRKKKNKDGELYDAEKYPLGKWAFPWINIKYFIRVILWRFLEISSRITLLVLTWVNLGGKAIFGILALEFCYLAVLAWALGTIDIMGNLIYLMAANSKRKGYRWAIPMAWVFWGWRVLSGWALLICITIYAASDVSYGADLLKNEGGETRYDQTFKNTAGLILFIYSWAATPLWQWIGAVVIFDYKNLASVGRDVDTLLEDGKWDQVLELVSFGAQFNPVTMLQKIERQTSVHPSNAGAATSAGLEDEVEAEQMVQAPTERNCPGGHGLDEFKADADGFRCDICSSKKREGDILYGCRDCNYDVCAACNGKEGEINIVVCDSGHELRKQATGYGDGEGGYICNECRSTSKAQVAWHCHDCQYDLCDKCYGKKSGKKSEKKTKKRGKSRTKSMGDASIPPIDRLAIMCNDQIAEEKEAENDKWAKAFKACELMCSCACFLILIGLAMLIFGLNYYLNPNTSTQDEGFFISVGPLIAAGILICCALSCMFDLFEKANDCCKNKGNTEMELQRKKSKAAALINCPRKHGLKLYSTEQDGLGCDLCPTKVSRGTEMYGCRDCNYDVCTNCKPVPTIEPRKKKTRKVDDETVACPKKHPLIPHKEGPHQCDKCKNEYKKQRSWYCKKCQYYLCLECFEAAQQSQGKKIISWMKNREIDDEKPILQYGFICWAVIIALALFFGADIAAIVIDSDYDCNMIGGSGFVSFNVHEWLFYGAVVHLSLLGWICCCGCCAMATDSDTNIYAAGCAVCCGFLFCIPWIVIGFLLHSEMTPENVPDDAQCIDMVYSWTIIKIIEFGGIPCLGCCAALCATIYEDREDAMGFIGYVCMGGCAFIVGVGFFLGSDIAMLVIHSKFDCDNALSGAATYLDPNTFVMGGSIGHLSALFLAMCCAYYAANSYDDNEIMLGCAFCCSCLFFVAWAVFGFLLHRELNKDTTNDKMCADSILAWVILKLIEFILLPACGMCVAFFG